MGKGMTEASFDSELRRHLGSVIRDPARLQEFTHWFRSALWDAESTAPEDILQFAYGIENVLGILDAGMWSTERLIDELSEEYRSRYSCEVTDATPKSGQHITSDLLGARP